MKYQVHWIHTEQNLRNMHGTYDTLEQAERSIYHWWSLNDFEPHYVRKWTKGNVTTFDYGSHHMFYEIYEIKNQILEQQFDLVCGK